VKALQLSSELATRILEEWVYVMLRLQVDNTVNLEYVEPEIEGAVRMAMKPGSDPFTVDHDDPPSRVVAAALIGRAWRRIANEWADSKFAAVGHDEEVATEEASS
jgi:hypothetical protein